MAALPETGRLLESDMEQRLIDHFQSFLPEPGKGFAFVARQMRMSAETKDTQCAGSGLWRRLLGP